MPRSSKPRPADPKNRILTWKRAVVAAVTVPVVLSGCSDVKDGEVEPQPNPQSRFDEMKESACGKDPVASMTMQNGKSRQAKNGTWTPPPSAPPAKSAAARLGATPDYTELQSYAGPRVGIDANYANAQGIFGAGVKITDVEYDWFYNHEELSGKPVEKWLQPKGGHAPYGDHGTAVLSILGAADDGKGITGLVPEASLATVSEYTKGRACAVAVAIAKSQPGDVVMLEMQIDGPGGGYGPAELDPFIHELVKFATDRGIHVVAAAGNGAQNLDAPEYASYRKLGDSGAIIVGAGSPDGQHTKLDFSTYGKRVDLQGFGGGVISAGYGDVYSQDITRTYTWFSGTSSATPIVAAAVALVESYAEEYLGRPLTPEEMSRVLSETGKKQGAINQGNIGELPDVRAALHAVTEMKIS